MAACWKFHSKGLISTVSHISSLVSLFERKNRPRLMIGTIQLELQGIERFKNGTNSSKGGWLHSQLLICFEVPPNSTHWEVSTAHQKGILSALNLQNSIVFFTRLRPGNRSISFCVCSTIHRNSAFKFHHLVTEALGKLLLSKTTISFNSTKFEQLIRWKLFIQRIPHKLNGLVM